MKKTGDNNIGYMIRNAELQCSLGLIAEIIADYFGMDERKIFKRDRTVNILKIRYIFMSLAKTLNKNVSYQHIGYYCMSAHKIKEYTHATVLNACREAQNFYDTDESFRFHYDSIKLEVLRLSKLVADHKAKIQDLRHRIVSDVIKAKSREAIYSALRQILLEESDRIERLANKPIV